MIIDDKHIPIILEGLQKLQPEKIGLIKDYDVIIDERFLPEHAKQRYGELKSELSEIELIISNIVMNLTKTANQ